MRTKLNRNIKGKGKNTKLVPIRDEAERNQIVIDNLDMAKHVASRLARTLSQCGRSTIAFDYDDLFQDAAMRLVERCGTIDFEKGKLSTHAYASMYSNAAKRSKRVSKPITIPESAQENLQRLRIAIQTHNLSDDVDPMARAKEITGMNDFLYGKATMAEKVFQGKFINFDREKTKNFVTLLSVGEETIDIDSDEVQPDTAYQLTERNLRIDDIEKKELVAMMLHGLTDQAAKILTMYFGLDGNAPMVFSEIAGVFGVKYQRIQKVMADAMILLRERFANSDYATEAA